MRIQVAAGGADARVTSSRSSACVTEVLRNALPGGVVRQFLERGQVMRSIRKSTIRGSSSDPEPANSHWLPWPGREERRPSSRRTVAWRSPRETRESPSRTAATFSEIASTTGAREAPNSRRFNFSRARTGVVGSRNRVRPPNGRSRDSTSLSVTQPQPTMAGFVEPAGDTTRQSRSSAVVASRACLARRVSRIGHGGRSAGAEILGDSDSIPPTLHSGGSTQRPEMPILP